METKKDALMGVRFGALERMLACALSALLAAGMVPAGAVAYAAEDGSESGTSQNAGEGSAPSAGDRVNQDVPLDTSGSGSDSAAGEGQGQGSDASVSLGQSAEGAGPGSGEAGSSGSAARYTASASGQTSADVRLDGSAKVGTIEYGGLAYTINADDPATVAVTGIASTAPKGDVSIPSQVASGSELYKVTKIARGGGYLRLILPVR